MLVARLGSSWLELDWPVCLRGCPVALYGLRTIGNRCLGYRSRRPLPGPVRFVFQMENNSHIRSFFFRAIVTNVYGRWCIQDSPWRTSALSRSQFNVSAALVEPEPIERPLCFRPVRLKIIPSSAKNSINDSLSPFSTEFFAKSRSLCTSASKRTDFLSATDRPLTTSQSQKRYGKYHKIT